MYDRTEDFTVVIQPLFENLSFSEQVKREKKDVVKKKEMKLFKLVVLFQSGHNFQFTFDVLLRTAIPFPWTAFTSRQKETLLQQRRCGITWYVLEALLRCRTGVRKVYLRSSSFGECF